MVKYCLVVMNFILLRLFCVNVVYVIKEFMCYFSYNGFVWYVLSYVINGCLKLIINIVLEIDFC